MFAKITDLIRAGIAWHDLYVRDRRASKEDAKENRMALYLSAAASDPVMFDHLLYSIKEVEARQLYHRLNSRVISFGSMLSNRDHQVYNALLRSLDALGLLFAAQAGSRNDSLRARHQD